MAQTAPAPSLQLWNSLLEGFYIKPEKFAQQLQEDDTFTKWLNVDHLPSMNASASTQNSSVSANTSLAPVNNNPSSQEQSANVTQGQGSAFSAVTPFYQTTGFQQHFQNSILQPGLTVQYTFNTGVPPLAKGSSVQNVNQLQSTGFTSIQLPQFLTQAHSFASPIQLQTVPPQAQVVQNQIMLPSFGFPQQNQQQPLTIVPQFYNMLTQFQPLKTSSPNTTTEEPEDRKRKSSSKTHQRPKRQTRPKVVEAKGAVQCKGKNKKRSAQCRNAALMEYIGPRPIYCAEHIELDPQSLYEKCRSPYQKEVGDKKGCKEVVLKEFGYCYKHYIDMVNEIVGARDYDKARKNFERTNELLVQLEREAAAAKKKDGDLYQRKNKLIPKFQEMKKVNARAVEELRPKDLPEELFPSNVLVAPVLNLSHEDLSECSEDSLEDSLKTQTDSDMFDQFS
jgi:hypothetical protein